MTVPTIHMNGTSRNRLLDDICEATDALERAYQAIKRCAPNGRDYYPQGPEALTTATNEHMDRLRKVEAVQSELNALAEAIAGQG
jgi:hypothetical protein